MIQSFVSQNNSDFALARFDLNKTWLELMIAVCVPGTLFILSFVTLMIITQTVRVGDDARMRCKWCGDNNNHTTNLQYEAIGKVDDNKNTSKDDEKNDVPLQHLGSNNKEESKINLLEENATYSNA